MKLLFQILIFIIFVGTSLKAQNELTYIEQLKNGQNFTIDFESQGCLHLKKESLLISNEKGAYIVKLYRKDQLKNTIELNKETLALFIDFEIKLRDPNLSKGKCTTEETYSLKFDNQHLQIKNTTCSWHGYEELISLIFEP